MRQPQDEITEIRPLLLLIPNLTRLQQLIRVVRESDPYWFDMKRFGWFDNKMPSCVLGNYAARRDIQQTFELRERNFDLVLLYAGGHYVKHNSPEVRGHFGISISEANELFGPAGCGGAITRNEALQYLGQFVAYRTPMARPYQRVL